MLLRDDPARIVTTRFAQHDHYDRLVIELDRSVSIVRRPETRWDDLIVDISAQPIEAQQDLATGSPRAGTLEIAATPSGARLSSSRRERKLRLFQLQDPPRLVVDFADARGTTLSAPAAGVAVPIQPAAPSFSAEAALELLPPSDGAEAPDAAVAAGLPLESEEPQMLGADAQPARADLATRLLYGIPLAVLFGALAALASRLTLDAWNRLRAAPERAAGWATLHVAQASGAPLEHTHDAELRARLALERRLAELQQEVDRLRAGLSRLTREGEGQA